MENNTFDIEKKELERLQGIQDQLQADIYANADQERATQDYAEKSRLSIIRQDMREEARKNLPFLMNQKNLVWALQNGGESIRYTDKKERTYDKIPSFLNVDTTNISFDEETILSEPVPKYVPEINESIFKAKGYVFEAIRIGENEYMMSVDSYRLMGDYEDRWDHNYVIVSLDQLALINDYYMKKAKATLQKEADDKSARNEAYYDKLPVEKREKHLNQPNYYKTLPVAVKKKITEEEWLKLDLAGKESYYKPYKKYGAKRMVSKLESDSMWVSFHEMYERFVNPDAKQPKQGYAHEEVWKYWALFRDMMKWKMKDIKVQRQAISEIRLLAEETSFGESNVNLVLLDQYGILVKNQDGSDIGPHAIEQIRESWIMVNQKFGNLKSVATDDRLKISHTGKKYVYASKAAGMYVGRMRTIAVSDKFGNEQFAAILAHEVAHYIDNKLGEAKGRRFITDEYEGLAGRIAFAFRKHMNEGSDSDYINSTQECFARAMEQYFAIEQYGEDAALIYSSNQTDSDYMKYITQRFYVSVGFYHETLKPMIEQFLADNANFFNSNPVLEEQIEVKTEQETDLRGYQKRISENFKYMKTNQDDWKSIPIIGFTVQKSDSGKDISVPIFEFPTGYTSAKSMFPQSKTAPHHCELCGKTPVKVLYHLQNDKTKETLSVGSECVTHFEEGNSGKDNVKDFKIKQAQTLASEIDQIAKILKDNFSKIKDLGYGKKKREWDSVLINLGDIDPMDWAVRMTEGFKKLSPKHLINPKSLQKDTLYWNYVYEKLPAFSGDQDSSEEEKNLLTWYTKNEEKARDFLSEVITAIDLVRPEALNNFKPVAEEKLDPVTEESTSSARPEILECFRLLDEKREVLNNSGRYLYIDHNGRIITVVSYNSGNRPDKSVSYSHNSFLLKNTLKDILGIDNDKAFEYAGMFSENSESWHNSIPDVKGDIILLDQNELICSSIKEESIYLQTPEEIEAALIDLASKSKNADAFIKNIQSLGKNFGLDLSSPVIYSLLNLEKGNHDHNVKQFTKFYKEKGVSKKKEMKSAKEESTTDKNVSNILALAVEQSAEMDAKISLSDNLGRTMLTEKEFYKTYKGQHTDLRSTTQEEKDQVKQAILENGFKEAMNANATSIYKGGKDDWFSQRFANKKGSVVYLIKNEGIKDSTNGYQVRTGYKPSAEDVIEITEDWQPSYDAYKASFLPKPHEENKMIETTESAHRITSISSFKDVMNKLYAGELSLIEYKAAYANMVSNKPIIMDSLNAMKKDELLSHMGVMMAHRYKSEKKSYAVDALWKDMLMGFAFGTVSYGFSEKIEDVITRKVEAATQEDLDKFLQEVREEEEGRKKTREHYKKSVENPETLEEFRTAMDLKGRGYIQTLSAEKQALYDELISGTTRAKKEKELEKKAHIAAVELGNTEMKLIETKHTKAGHDLFVVQLSNRIEKDVYNDLNIKAKRLGGYYSSFRGGGAVPGFQFKEKAQAEKFMGLQEGSVSNLDKVVERKEDSKQAAAERLRTVANQMIEKADEELNKERLTNTNKRASQASSMEARAREQKRMAETMLNISNAIENGSALHLDGIKAKTHIEVLDSYISQAKNSELNSKYPNYTEFLNHKGEPATVETVQFLKMGLFPKLHVSNVQGLITEVKGKSGLKLIAARWQKILDELRKKGVEDFTPTSHEKMDEFADMMSGMKNSSSTILQMQLDNYKRLKGMGIENDSMLRSALREYVQFRGGLEKADRVKELERAVVGKKVGLDFFPTPTALAQKMVEQAQLQEGDEILEPSAGNGNIADVIKAAGYMPKVIELSSTLREILEAKGYTVVDHNFMDYNEAIYDKIIMNPPFSDSQDIEHVLHAYQLLKPGGRIVAIMGEGAFFRSDKKAKGFQDWIHEMGFEYSALPIKTFTDTSLLSTTNANARIIILNKPAGEAVQPPETENMETSVKVGQVYLNTTNDKNVIVDKIEDGFVYLQVQGAPYKDLYNYAPESLEFFERYVRDGVYEIQNGGSPIEVVYQNIKECLLNDEDNQNDFIVEGTQLINTEAGPSETWEIIGFTKTGVEVKHVLFSALSSNKGNKWISFSDIKSLFERSLIAVNGINAGDVRTLNLCIKSIKKCMDHIDQEDYHKTVQAEIQENFYKYMPHRAAEELAQYWGNLKYMWHKNEINLDEHQIEKLKEVQFYISKFFPEYNKHLTSQPVGSGRDVIDGIKISRESIEDGKTRIRMEKGGFIMGIVYPTIMYPNTVTDEQAIASFKWNDVVDRIKSEVKLMEADPTYENDEAENKIFEDIEMLTGWHPHEDEADQEYILGATNKERLEYALEHLKANAHHLAGPVEKQSAPSLEVESMSVEVELPMLKEAFEDITDMLPDLEGQDKEDAEDALEVIKDRISELEPANDYSSLDKKYNSRDKQIKVVKKKGNIITFKEPITWGADDSPRKQIIVTGFEKDRKTGSVKIVGKMYDTQWFTDEDKLLAAVDWRWMSDNVD